MIGIVVPMEKEAWKLIERLEGRESTEIHGRPVFSGTLGKAECRLILSGCGKVHSASATQMLLDKFPIEEVFHFGSAGGAHPDIRIGDVAIGQEIVEYDYYQKFGEPRPEPNSYSDAGLIKEFLSKAPLEMKFIVGRILSGNEDVITTARRDELTKLHGGLTVDWESGACALVCNLMKVPVLVLRAVVDYAYEGTPHEFSTNVRGVSERLGGALADFIESR
jgi:adenosylhomocysteine nucleosidase